MDLAWQCKCGSIVYDSVEPDECLACGKIASFTQLPAELIEERMKEAKDEDFDLELDAYGDGPSTKNLAKTVKSVKAKSRKSKLKKPKRK